MKLLCALLCALTLLHGTSLAAEKPVRPNVILIISDAQGFPEIQIENAGIRMPASRTSPDDPWVRFAITSMEKSLERRVQVIPNGGGGLPGDVFVDFLGVPLVWIPHSYNGCKQHGPNEHFLIAPAREGIAAYAGIWWDLGEAGVP